MLAAAPNSPRAERPSKLATCADDFLGAVLHDQGGRRPATDASEPPGDACAGLAATLRAVTPRPGARRGAATPFLGVAVRSGRKRRWTG